MAISPTAAAVVGVGSLLAGAGATVYANQQSNAAQKKLMNSLTKPIEPQKSLPTPNSESVNQAKLKSLFDLQNRSGRASTLLTTATTDKFGG